MVGTESVFRHILKCFALDLTATKTAQLSPVSLRSATVIIDKLRDNIFHWTQEEAPFTGTVEIDESYFGPRLIPGKRDGRALD